MATMTAHPPSRPPAFTNRERHTLRQLGSLVQSLDYTRQRCTALERAIVGVPEGFKRDRLIRSLFDARRAEECAVLNLRDGTAHLVGLVRPIGAAS